MSRVDFAYLRAVRAPSGPRTAAARAIATLIGLRADSGIVRLDRGEIAEQTLLGRRVVRRALCELLREGWLAEERRVGELPAWTTSIPEPTEMTTSGQPERPPAVNRKVDRVTTNGRSRDHQRSTGATTSGQRTVLGVQDGFSCDSGHLSTWPAACSGSGSLSGSGSVSGSSLISDAGSTPSETPGETPGDLRAREVQAQPEEIPDQKLPPRGSTLALPGLEAPAAPKPIDPLQAPEVTEVLQHWRSAGYHTRKPIDNAERRKRISDRLADGLDVATLKAAIDGAELDDFLMGRAKGRNEVGAGGKRYTGLETILRDAAQVERLATLTDLAREASGGPVGVKQEIPMRTAEEQEELERLRAQALERLAQVADRHSLAGEARRMKAKALELRALETDPILLAAQERADRRTAEIEQQRKWNAEQQRMARGMH